MTTQVSRLKDSTILQTNTPYSSYSKNPSGGRTPTSFSGAITFNAVVDLHDSVLVVEVGEKADTEAASTRMEARNFIVALMD